MYNPKRIYARSKCLGSRHVDNFSTSPQINVAVRPKTSNLFLQISRLFSENSTIVSSAPLRAKLILSVPIPQPISSTFLPFHLLKSANLGIWGSTKYFFFPLHQSIPCYRNLFENALRCMVSYPNIF